MKKIILSILALSLMLIAVSCTSNKNVTNAPSQTQEPTSVEASASPDPNADAPNPAAGIVQAGADEAKQIDVTTIKSIELFDLDNNKVEKSFTDDEIAAIGKAYNESMIDDISYIEMLAGYSMDITLTTGQVIHITSYGNENNVVATTDGVTYHLICPEIGKILLTEIKE